MEAAARALTRQQVRELDRLAIQDWGVPGVVLMENAGAAAARVIDEYLGGACGRGIAIIAGVGNNGGDGFVIARHLHIRSAAVVVFLVGDPAKMTPDAAVNFAILRRLKIQVRPRSGEAISRLAAELGQFDLLVDALGGTGVEGALRGETAQAVAQLNAAGRPVAAVDIPTGLDCDTGQALGPAVKADLTITFLARKLGFDAPGAEAYTGKVIVADIGIPPP